MKFTLNILEKRGSDDDTEAEHRWPQYVFGGRMRTSTFVLIVAFLLVWWVYDTYRPEPAPKPPAQQVVPPGFVPESPARAAAGPPRTACRATCAPPTAG